MLRCCMGRSPIQYYAWIEENGTRSLFAIRGCYKATGADDQTRHEVAPIDGLRFSGAVNQGGRLIVQPGLTIA